MLLLRIFRRFLCIILIVRATLGQRNEQQQHEFVTDTSQPLLRSLLHVFPDYARKSPMHKQYENENRNPTFEFQQLHRQQTENGNSLAATEIAMEILSRKLPSSAKSFDDVFKEQKHQTQPQPQQQQWHRLPFYWQELIDFSSKRTNFLRSQSYAQQLQRQQREQQQEQEMEKLSAQNSNWLENTKGLELNTNLAPEDNDDSATMRVPSTQTEAAHVVRYDDVGNDANRNMEQKLATHLMLPKNMELHNDMVTNIMKRNPLAIDNYKTALGQPRYPFSFFRDDNDDADDERNLINHMKLRSTKRERTPTTRTAPFLPSISAGAMTNLGSFFGDLTKNIHFNEQHDIHEAKAKFLEGDHPLRMLQKDVEFETNENTKIDKTAQFLHAIRSYRPSQKIRSLVSMTPHGYHGSNFLDPNYMWVGLG